MTTAERKVAWVTGASRGMGADTAIRLAEAGYDVALTARDQDRLDNVADLVREHGVDALPMSSDLTSRASVAAFADRALEHFGRADVLVNIGIYQGPSLKMRFVDTPLDELAVNNEADVIAPALLCQRALPWMRTHGGTIVNMSSSSVFLDPPGPVGENGWSFAYVAAKAGIDQLASIINVELGAEGVRAFNVEPGFVAYADELEELVRQYPGMPVSPPESIGPAIAWLIESPEAEKLLKKRVYLPGLTFKQGLLQGWDGPGTHYRSTAPA
jgi:NAD(P)-dependent dehydrogenase (short-subunit alcohol dehydrogenase family)